MGINFKMDFGQALDALKSGERIQRKGWNGKGMWLVLVPGTKNVAYKEESLYHKIVPKTTFNIDPHIDMYTAQGSMQPGWLASQSDILANDWRIYNV